MFDGSGWKKYGRYGVKELFSLVLDEFVWVRDSDKVSTSCCLEICFEVDQKG